MRMEFEKSLRTHFGRGSFIRDGGRTDFVDVEWARSHHARVQYSPLSTDKNLMSYEMNDLLELVFEEGASDLHIQVGKPPTLRLDAPTNAGTSG